MDAVLSAILRFLSPLLIGLFIDAAVLPLWAQSPLGNSPDRNFSRNSAGGTPPPDEKLAPELPELPRGSPPVFCVDRVIAPTSLCSAVLKMTDRSRTNVITPAD